MIRYLHIHLTVCLKTLHTNKEFITCDTDTDIYLSTTLNGGLCGLLVL